MKREKTLEKLPTSSTEEKRPRQDFSSLVLQVFCNDVLMRLLEKFLDYDDLKSFRRVNTSVNKTILKNSSFVSSTNFLINRNTVRSNVLDQIGFELKAIEVHLFPANKNVNYVCKNSCIQAVVPAEKYQKYLFENETYSFSTRRQLPTKVWTEAEIQHVYNACETVDQLTVVGHKNLFLNKCLCDIPDEASLQFFPSIKQILKVAKNLTKLTLQTYYIRHVLGDHHGDAYNYLENITDLEIRDCPVELNCPSLQTLGKLQRLSLKMTSRRQELSRSQDSLVITELLRNNCNSLKEIELLWSSRTGTSVPPLLYLSFPLLEKLDINFFTAQALILAPWLRMHSENLAHVSLHCESRPTGDKVDYFPREILESIATMSKCRHLELTAEESELLSHEDLLFLNSMALLQTFKIDLHQTAMYSTSNDSDVEDEDEEAERVFGLDVGSCFNCVPTQVGRLSLSCDCDYSGDPLSVLKIASFLNLESLQLYKCYKAVTNETLQHIFKNLTNLKELVITKATDCTDEGFAGRGEGAVSIGNLKRLEKLVLLSCGIRDCGESMEKIAFTRLKFLDVSGKEEHSELCIGCCRKLLSQNPSLAVLRVPLSSDVNTSVEIGQLKKTFQQLKQLEAFVSYGEYIML